MLLRTIRAPVHDIGKQESGTNVFFVMRLPRLDETLGTQNSCLFDDGSLAAAPRALLRVEYCALRSFGLWWTLNDKISNFCSRAVLPSRSAVTIRANANRLRCFNYKAIPGRVTLRIALELRRTPVNYFAGISSLIHSFRAKRGSFSGDGLLARPWGNNGNFVAYWKNRIWVLRLLMNVLCLGVVFLGEFFKEPPDVKGFAWLYRCFALDIMLCR